MKKQDMSIEAQTDRHHKNIVEAWPLMLDEAENVKRFNNIISDYSGGMNMWFKTEFIKAISNAIIKLQGYTQKYKALGTPEELTQLQSELQKYRDDEAAGMLIRLPCKVGDSVTATVLRPYNGHELTIHGEIIDVQTVARVKYDSCRHVDFLASDFGKTIFLTESEAKAALQAQEGDKT